eukprot:865850-Alexandrium_andersonii.AAC.1
MSLRECAGKVNLRRRPSKMRTQRAWRLQHKPAMMPAASADTEHMVLRQGTDAPLYVVSFSQKVATYRGRHVRTRAKGPGEIGLEALLVNGLKALSDLGGRP